MTAPLTYSVEEAARLLGVSRGVGYEAARNGQLPTIRLGRRLLVPKAALERMLGLPGGGENCEEVHGPDASASTSGWGDSNPVLNP